MAKGTSENKNKNMNKNMNNFLHRALSEMEALDGWECWTLRAPTELESQQLDATYTYGHPTEDGQETS
jgi:hypothetical protein